MEVQADSSRLTSTTSNLQRPLLPPTNIRIGTVVLTNGGANQSISYDAVWSEGTRQDITGSVPSDGVYEMTIVAMDSRTRVAAEPVRYRWSVDTTLPETYVLSYPNQRTACAEAAFYPSSSKGNARYDYCVDRPQDHESSGACYQNQVQGAGLVTGATNQSSPLRFTDTHIGSQYITIRARTLQGVDGAPWSYAWYVDMEAPQTHLVRTPTRIIVGAGLNSGTTVSSAGSNDQSGTGDDITDHVTHLKAVLFSVSADEPVSRFDFLLTINDLTGTSNEWYNPQRARMIPSAKV